MPMNNGRFKEGHPNYHKSKYLVCVVPKCQNPSLSKGYCSKHYQRFKRWGNPISTAQIGRKKMGQEIQCVRCGKSVYKTQRYLNGKARFCSRKCAFEHRRGEIRVPLIDRHWSLTAKGYLFTMLRGKRILQHRWIVERALKRSLSPTEIVHHVNGNKLDNRLENLLVCDKNQHGKGHKELFREYLRLRKQLETEHGKQI
jgi:hypothetical protein